MGFPISKYRVLKSLAHYDKDSYEGKAIRASLDKFSLFAIVIHDPEVHTDFDAKLNHLFDELDYITGPNMLFISLIRPSNKLSNQIMERDYYKFFSLDQAENILKQNPWSYEVDNSFAANALASALEIDYDKLPVIVFTNSLLSKKIYWLETNEDLLFHQMKELGYLAHRNPLIKQDWNLASYVIMDLQNKKLDFSNLRYTWLNSLISKILFDFLSYETFSNTNNVDYNEAKKDVWTNLKLDINNITQIKNKFRSQDESNDEPDLMLASYSPDRELQNIDEEKSLADKILFRVCPYSHHFSLSGVTKICH